LTQVNQSREAILRAADAAAAALESIRGVAVAALPDASDPSPEPPAQPRDLRARLYPEGGFMVVELVWSMTDNVGALDTLVEVQSDSNPADGREQWAREDTLPAGSSTWEDKFLPAPGGPAQFDVPVAYRVRGVKTVGGMTYYSAWSEVADPEPFVVEHQTDPDRRRVSPGFDFSKKTGRYLAAPGAYPTFEFESGLDVLCDGAETGARMVFKLKDGEQWLHRGATDVVLDGIEVVGGGKSKRLNDQCAFSPGTRWTVRDFLVRGALGVGMGCDGKAIRLIRGEARDCGSAGIGGKASASIFINLSCHDNNDVVHDRDGATGGKWTRSEGQLFLECVVTGGTNAGWWHDINNCNVLYVRCEVRGIKLSDETRQWTAAGWKEEISESVSKAADTIIALAREVGVLGVDVTEAELRKWNYNYRDCVVKGTASYPVDWNETQLVYWRGGEIEETANKKEGGSAGLRDQPRADAKAKGQEKNWRLGDILVEGVTATTGTFTFWGSGAGNKLSAQKYRITARNVKGTVKWHNIAA
jgi:hypothetical protein